MTTVFVESLGFSREVARLSLDGDLRRLQWFLREHPDAGVLVPGTGGLRKIRLGISDRGRGKRAGVRIHYLWLPERDVIYLLNVYAKSESTRLSETQKAQLRGLVRRLKQE